MLLRTETFPVFFIFLEVITESGHWHHDLQFLQLTVLQFLERKNREIERYSSHFLFVVSKLFTTFVAKIKSPQNPDHDHIQIRDYRTTSPWLCQQTRWTLRQGYGEAYVYQYRTRQPWRNGCCHRVLGALLCGLCAQRNRQRKMSQGQVNDIKNNTLADVTVTGHWHHDL